MSVERHRDRDTCNCVSVRVFGPVQRGLYLKERFMSNEPVWSVAGITAVVAAVVALLAAFGVPLSDEQVQAVLGLVAAAAPLVVAYFSRKRVKPVHCRERGRRGFPEF